MKSYSKRTQFPNTYMHVEMFAKCRYLLYKKNNKHVLTHVFAAANEHDGVNDLVVNFSTKHYNDVIMGAIASLITSLTIVYSTVYSDADQRKHQSSASLAFVWGIHWGPVNSPPQMASNAENVFIWWRHHERAVIFPDSIYKGLTLQCSLPVMGFICTTPDTREISLNSRCPHWGIIRLYCFFIARKTTCRIKIDLTALADVLTISGQICAAHKLSYTRIYATDT